MQVGPSRRSQALSPAPRSPASRSPAPGSPCPSRSGSPLPHRCEISGSTRTNVYGTSVLTSSQPMGTARSAERTPPRAHSPMPGQSQPTMQLATCGAAWPLQGHSVLPSTSGPTVRYARTSNPALPLSLSPHHGDAHFAQPQPAAYPDAPTVASARTASMPRSATPGAVQRSTTPVRAHQRDVSCMSPQPMQPPPQITLPLVGAVAGDLDMSMMSGSTQSAPLLPLGSSSFILTRPQPTLSSSVKATVPEAAMAVTPLKQPVPEMPHWPESSMQLRTAASPQPSRSMSPMPQSPMSGNVPPWPYVWNQPTGWA